MPFVVTDSCINCKFTDCAEQCPTQAFREGRNMVVIDPDSCIDCHACAAVCPTQAIYPDSELPAHLQTFIDLNARLARHWPMIVSKRTPLGSPADGRSSLALLDERPGGEPISEA